jgi:hypothetical protein
MKKILVIVGAILLAVVIAAGSFYGGMAYQTNQANQVRANFFNSRGLGDNGQLPGNGSGFPNNGQNPGFQNGGQNSGFFGGGGTVGQVKTIEGNVMTVSTARDVTTINLSDSTQIEKPTTGSVADLKPGVQVMVTGQRDSNGEITASQITILSNNPFGPVGTPTPGTGP